MEVCEYLNSLSDSDIQQQKPRALRISNEVLFCSETYRCQVQSETSAESAAERYLRQWYDESSKQICICKDDFSTVLTAVAERAQSDRIDACKMFCYALSNICTSQVELLTEMLQSAGGVKALFLSEFPNLAKAAEQQCDYRKCGASSPEYTLWALLNGKARPSPQGYHLLIDQAGQIHLRGLTWLTCGYHMALKLDITGFLTLLSQLRSPMMFDTLAFQMAISPLDRELYCAAAGSELLYVRLLSAEWLFNAIRDERSQFEVAREIWNRFEPDVRALQEAIVLSNVVFHVRTRRLESEAQWQAIQEVLLSKLASDLPACSGEVINTALFPDKRGQGTRSVPCLPFGRLTPLPSILFRVPPPAVLSAYGQGESAAHNMPAGAVRRLASEHRDRSFHRAQCGRVPLRGFCFPLSLHT